MKDIYKDRDEELYRIFKDIFFNTDLSYKEAVIKAVNSPCSRYWLSSDYVYREIISRLNNYKWNRRRKAPRTIREKAYEQLYEKFLELSQMREFRGCSARFISSFLVARPAPSFFLSPRRAKDIISKIRNKKKP
jgi:hypothetical protein